MRIDDRTCDFCGKPCFLDCDRCGLNVCPACTTNVDNAPLCPGRVASIVSLRGCRHVIAREELMRLRKKTEAALDPASDSLSVQQIFRDTANPQTVLALLDYIDELEERTGEKDPEND